MTPDDLLEPPPHLPPALRSVLEATDTEPGVRRLRWGALALFLLAVLAFVAVGANRPPDPRLGPAVAGGPRAAARPAVEGFGQITFRIGPGDAAALRCAILADTAEQRSRGMMGRRDQAGHDAMLFRFESESTGSFYMRNVPIPLSIAWFDDDGNFVGSADMAPCEDREGCPLYPPPAPYRYAIEVPQGGLGALGVREGAVLELGGPCSG